MSFPDACSKCTFLDASRSPCRCSKGYQTVYGYAQGRAGDSSGRQLLHCEHGQYPSEEKPSGDLPPALTRIPEQMTGEPTTIRVQEPKPSIEGLGERKCIDCGVLLIGNRGGRKRCPKCVSTHAKAMSRATNLRYLKRRQEKRRAWKASVKIS